MKLFLLVACLGVLTTQVRLLIEVTLEFHKFHKFHKESLCRQNYTLIWFSISNIHSDLFGRVNGRDLGLL